MEYREAYKLHKEGAMKILSFVRQEVWQMKEERNALAKHLETLGLDPGLKGQIVSHPSKAANDADFIISFIDEVRRNRETLSALKGEGPLPTGNWIHVFSEFKEIVEQLEIQAFMGIPVEQAAMRRLLRLELFDMLRTTLLKFDRGIATDPADAVAKLYAGIRGTLDITQDFSPAVAIGRDELFLMFQLASNVAAKIYHPHVLPTALTSSTFLEYDRRTGRIVEPPVYLALLKLQSELDFFKLVEKMSLVKDFMNYMNDLTDTRHDRGASVMAQKMHISMAMHLLDRWVNIGKLCKAIIKHLDGKPFVMPTLQRKSPMYEDAAMDKFQPTDLDTSWYLTLEAE